MNFHLLTVTQLQPSVAAAAFAEVCCLAPLVLVFKMALVLRFNAKDEQTRKSSNKA